MADDSHGHRSMKFHEGWLQIKVKGKWTRYWAVLRGQTIYFFHSDKTTEQNHVGTLYLDGQTEVKSLTSETFSKKFYKIELYTHHPVRKCNRFKFEKKNTRDVWKSFILGVSTGVVPRDVEILPGQLKDVVEAIGEVMRTPPPLPTLPRPRLKHPHDFNRQASSKSSERSWGSNGSEESDGGSGGFGSHITSHPVKTTRSKSGYERERNKVTSVPGLDDEVTNLRTLYRRQSELALKTLDPKRSRSPEPRGGVGVGGGFSDDGEDSGSESSVMWSDNMTFGSPPPRSVRSPHASKFSEFEDLESGGSSLINGGFYGADHSTSPLMTSARPSSPPPVSPGAHSGGGGERRGSMYPAPPARQTSDYGSTHSEVHLFYTDSGRNRDHPPWFFENTSRELAESILTLGKRYGNVLMRESVTFKSTGSYVISMRREVAGGTQLNHYEVRKTPQGFKINVDNDHHPMRCLSDVMDFFVRQAGPGSAPLSTNNLGQLGLNVPSGGRRGPVDDAPDSGVEDDDVRSNSSQPHVTSHMAPHMTSHPRAAAGQRAPPGKMHLNVSGSVPSEMHQTAMEIEYTMKKSTPKWDESRLSVPPVPPPPPPPPGGMGGPAPAPPPLSGPPTDYSGTARYGEYDSRSRGAGPPPEGGFSDPNLNRTVPPRLPPSETLQRAGGHPDVYYNHHRDQHRGRQHSSPERDYPQDPYDSHHSGMGGPPPPPPMPGMGGPPPPPSVVGMGGPPPPPSIVGMGGAPPPGPPSAPAPPPASRESPPSSGSSLQAMLANASLQPVSAGRRPSDTSSQASGSSSGFGTTPNRPRGGMSAAPTFEDELKKRLIAQREDVYASGATVLKSNWKEN